MTFSPLQRLQVNDGMLITADHWQIAHSYHRQRQTIHYESAHQGGIVSGLGISVGSVPEGAPSKYRQPRWLTIQPGLAIDAKGNPIVVANAESCYLSAQLSKAATIYVVLRHSERTSQVNADVVQEAFQILEKDVPAADNEIELCRVQMTPEATAITVPENVFSPGINQLDLRYRQTVQARPQMVARVAPWTANSDVVSCYGQLFNALPALHSGMKGEIVADRFQSDLIHLRHQSFSRLDKRAKQNLAAYVKKGGVVLVEAENAKLSELYQVEAELKRAIALSRNQSTSALQGSAKQELTEIQACIKTAVDRLATPFHRFIESQGLPMPTTSSDDKSALPLSEPFQFGHLPTIHQYPIGLYGWGGLLLVVGRVSAAWGCGPWLDLPRDEIRCAQELGVNLLQFAARRHQLHQWLGTKLAAPSTATTRVL